MKGSKLIAIQLMSLLVLLAPTLSYGVSQEYERVDYTYGHYEESVSDLKVKVLGGHINANRTYVRGKWVFKYNWNKLRFIDRNNREISNLVSDPSSIRKIDRNDYIYSIKSSGAYYEYDQGSQLRIVPTETGYRWSNRKGDWIDYNKNGVAQQYGNKNNVIVELVGGGTKPNQVKDHHGAVILTWKYNDAGNPISVTDYQGRKVSYEWQGDNLTKVTDTLGRVWEYTYEVLGNNETVLKSKKDPFDQTHAFNYAMSTSGQQEVCSGGEGRWVSEVITDPQTGEETTVETFVNSGQQCTTMMVAPMLMLVSRVYPDGKRIKYQYYYNANIKTYSLVQQNSDGDLTERWYDLDGQLQQEMTNGKLASRRIRVNNKAVTSDVYGNKTVTTYNRWNSPSEMSYPDGSTITTRYHTQYSFKTKQTDQLGIETHWLYDNTGNLIKEVSAKGTDDERVTTYEYDQYGQRIKQTKHGKTDADNSTQTYQYDGYGNLTQRTDGNGNTVQHQEYTALGKATKIIDGRNNTWKFEYDLEGNLTKETSPLNFNKVSEYDALNRLIKKIDQQGRTSTFSYDARNNMTGITDADNKATLQSFRMDGQLLSSTDAVGNTKSYQYDRNARLKKIIDGEGRETILHYEREDESSGNRVSKVETPNQVMLYQYDKLNRRTADIIASADNSINNKTSYQYDKRGDTTSMTDANGKTNQYSINGQGEQKRHTNPALESVEYQYDRRANLVSVTDAMAKTTSYLYDKNNNRLRETKPMGEQIQYEYDANNNLTKKTDANGNITQYLYDKDNRLSKQTETSEGQSAIERSIDYSYDKSDRQMLVVIKDASGTMLHTISYQYDTVGRLSQQTTHFGSFGKSLSYQYYANGQRKSITDAEGKTTTYLYDKTDMLAQLKIQNAGSITIAERQGALPSKIQYPGGIKRSQKFDGIGRLQQIKVANSADQTLLDYQYEFDAADNILQKSTKQGAFNYRYDNAYRLTQAGQPNSFGNQSYTYDKNSNRLSSPNTRYEYNDNHELIKRTENTKEINYSYDANGAQTEVSNTGETAQTAQTTRFNYNSAARLQQIQQLNGTNLETIAEYQYDNNNRRIKSTENNKTTYYLYDSSGLIAEYDQTGQLVRGYVYPPAALFMTGPVAQKRLSPNDTTQTEYAYYQNDHLSTPQALIATSGAIVWQAEYDVFGEVNETNMGWQNPLRFPGQYQDSTGLYYNWNRYYDSSLGRYVTSDPIGLGGGLNTFGYVGGNPLVYSDPEGFKKCRWTTSGYVCTYGSEDLPNGPFGPVCGPQGNPLATWIFDGIFRSACFAHDKCYDCSGTSRAQCDNEFLKDLRNACHKQYGVRFGRQTCDRLALHYYQTVNEGGDEYYKDKGNPSECPECK